MDSIRIDQPNLKRILINEDESKVLEFDPSDVAFIERFYKVFNELKAKIEYYQQRNNDLGSHVATDELGVPLNVGDRLKLLSEACDYIRGLVDDLFGAGTAQMVFGDARSLRQFEIFFEQLTPFIEKPRAEKLKPYVVPRRGGKKQKRSGK
ncbi:MAG: hypothetical protein KF821_01875 [Anaerolineales bacterium]|nr:hypothetical protein [Anaerolineales bacterium]